MEIVKCSDYKELSEYLGKEILDCMKSKEKTLICLASGDTPLGAFEYIVNELGNEDLSKYNFTFVGLDEWVGMDKDDYGSCQDYMEKYLFGKLNLGANQVIEFNAKAEDLDKECKRMDDFILSNGGLDLVVLGVGMNGHLGLNEPNVSFDNYSHTVELSENTKKVAQKYFNSEKKLEKGITIGIKHFLEAKKEILVISGEKKADIVKKLIEEEVSEAIPATSAKMHKNSILIIDSESSSKL
ncbi:MAG: glucosamine-6-phosphate deaminase [Sebaldella sp.]|nr:glucosamine-6-phosphate deaminase [Sebaldella sp.]